MKINKYWETGKRQRRNKTYKGKLTKMRQAKQNRELIILLTVWIISIVCVAFFSITNDIKIDGNPVNAKVETRLLDNSGNETGNNRPVSETPLYETLPFVEKMTPIEEQIWEIAEEHNFKWKDYLIRLAKCESSLDPNAINDNGKYGKDWGLFQWNDYYHPEMKDCAMEIECSTIATMNAINAGKQSMWVCDKKIN